MNIESLLMPRQNSKAKDRKVWSIPLEGIWLPFFIATNVEGKTDISSESLGAPLRLARDTDGAVKFSKKGRPIFRVVPELAEQIKIVRENFSAQLQAYANAVKAQNPEGYKAEIGKAQNAGRPILDADIKALEEAIELLKTKELAETAIQTSAKKSKAKELAETKA